MPTDETTQDTSGTQGHVASTDQLGRAAAKWEAVRRGKTYRVHKAIGDGRVLAVMRPGVGRFESKHQRVYMTRQGAQAVADDLNARGL